MARIPKDSKLKDDANLFSIWTTPDLDRECDPQEQGAEEIQVWFRQLRAGDMRRITDSMMTTDKKGNSRILPGTSGREKVVRSIVAVEGLDDPSGNPVDRITPDLFDTLPSWFSERLLAIVNEINGEDDLGN